MHLKTRCAIVGMGRWGQVLHEASAACDHLEVCTVVTRTPANVADYCEKYRLQLTEHLNDVLEDEEVDALIIATPHSQHFDQLLRAAESGKHVYCEKPFTLDYAQAQEALAALEKSNCKVAIGHNRRFAPNTLALQEMIAEGWFGKLIHIDGCFHANMTQAKGRWRDSVDESPAGGMTSLGIHAVDMLINLMGPVEELSASSERIAATCAFDDHTSASLKFTNGGRGQLTTFTSTAMRWRITLYGTNGWAELDGLDNLEIHPVDGESERRTFPGYDYPGIASITSALDAFAKDVQGVAPFPVSRGQIAHATQVLQGIVDSSGSGETVRF
ncbi:MAG: Gfo/Idh/MocA family oxidoreductase [Granulosicoccus sp.]|nr:Gfo/Idh/MocA family oxidoreductase [Granulosicoccus sp.]